MAAPERGALYEDSEEIPDEVDQMSKDEKALQQAVKCRTVTVQEFGSLTGNLSQESCSGFCPSTVGMLRCNVDTVSMNAVVVTHSCSTSRYGAPTLR